MNEYTLDKLAKVTGVEGAPEGGDDFNIKSINEIIKNISVLVQQYQQIKGGAPAPDGQVKPGSTGGGFTGKFAPTAANTPPKVAHDIRIDQGLQYVDAMLRKCAEQGMGETPVMQVLASLPITVNQAILALGVLRQ